MKRLELTFSIILLIIGCIYFVTSFQYNMFSQMGGIGAGFLPRIISAILIVLTLFYIFNKKERKEEATYTKKVLKQHAIMVVSLLLIIILLERLGMFVTLGLFLIGSLYYFEKNSILKSLIFSVVVCVSMFFIFVKWLQISLPSGLLF